MAKARKNREIRKYALKLKQQGASDSPAKSIARSLRRNGRLPNHHGA